MPPGAPPFRAEGCIVLFPSEEAAYGLTEGAIVDVRFDPADHTVLVVPKDVGAFKRQQEAARRAREEALLRGRPGS
jgi:hypothetical protein